MAWKLSMFRLRSVPRIAAAAIAAAAVFCLGRINIGELLIPRGNCIPCTFIKSISSRTPKTISRLPGLWLDTVMFPFGGAVGVITDFSDPVIRGRSVLHCHLLNHEDKGMMAKVVFE